MPRVIAVAATAVLAASSAPAFGKDYAATARNIIPSGQYGGFPVPAGADQQALMYDSLTPRFDASPPPTSRPASSPRASASDRTGRGGPSRCRTTA